MKSKSKIRIKVNSCNDCQLQAFENGNQGANDIDRKLYRQWRETQRVQLGISANLYMIFASAIMGYVLNFIVSNKGRVDCEALESLMFGIGFLLLSLVFYGSFTHNRLKDFRLTARYLKEGKTEDQVSELTNEIGQLTWKLYDFQRYCLLVGFIISLIGFTIYLFK